MADEEFRVEVDLGSHEHRLTFWERLRALGLDDDARKRLGSRVTVTRDGDQIFLYTHSLDDAREAERTVHALVADDHLSADVSVTRWNPDAQEWADPDGAHAPDTDTGRDVGIPNPAYVFLEAYKPEFLRDFGL